MAESMLATKGEDCAFGLSAARERSPTLNQQPGFFSKIRRRSYLQLGAPVFLCK
jgi:hypothetical protein